VPRSHLFAPEHEEFRGTVRRFIDKEVRPHVDDWEEAQQFPRELFTRFGALDLLGLKYPEEYGGTNAGVRTSPWARCSVPVRARVLRQRLRTVNMIGV